jgi:hypothetical protein
MRLLLFALAALTALVAAPAAAQVSNPPAVPNLPDPATIATKQNVADAIVQSTPGTCPMPERDTLSGSAGVGDRCMPRSDNSRPSVIQAKTTITAADSSYSVTFDVPFPSTPIYADARVYGVDQPYICTVKTLTTTGATGRCFQLVATTLPTLTTSLLGLVVSPVASAAGNLSVRVVARQ